MDIKREHKRGLIGANKWCLSLFVFCFLSFALTSWANIGLEVNPDEINIENVRLGKKIAISDLGGEKVKLSIKNKGALACTYSIDILYTAKTTVSLGEGYKDIPDTHWIIPENKELRIPANSAKVVELYLKIPKNKKYYGKKYQAVIEVKSKKNSSQEIFVLACQLKLYFSTIKAEVKAK